MSVSSPYQTFKDIQDAVLVDTKLGEAGREQVKRWINQGYMDLITRRKREFLDSQVELTLPTYITDDVSVTQGSPTVTWVGTSTQPLTLNASLGYSYYSGGTQEIYDVNSSTSSSLTLSTNYIGASTTSTTGYLVVASALLPNNVKAVVQAYHDYDTWTTNDVTGTTSDVAGSTLANRGGITASAGNNGGIFTLFATVFDAGGSNYAAIAADIVVRVDGSNNVLSAAVIRQSTVNFFGSGTATVALSVVSNQLRLTFAGVGFTAAFHNFRLCSL